MPNVSVKTLRTVSASFSRSRPLLTKTGVSWSPIARCSSAAATDESTPPLSASSTLPSPTRSRMSRIAASMNDSDDQEESQPHISMRKFRRMSPPRGVCCTSGWNWMPA